MRTLRRTLFALALTASAFAQPPAQGDAKQTEIYGQKIYYLEAGSGPVVILLHGLGGDRSNWAMNIQALSSSFHVYVPDQIGFGQSDKPLIDYRVGTLVDFLNGFYRKMGIARATLVGNSLGGWEAAAFTQAYPDKVERLVLVDSAGYSPQRTGGEKLSRDALLALNPSTLAGTKHLMSIVFYNQAMMSDPVVERVYADRMRRNDSYTIDRFIDSVARGDEYLDGKLGGIKTPTLIVWGREDKLIALAAGDAFARDIAGSQMVVLDHCGHVPQVECAGPFNTALLKFLGGGTPQEGQ